MRQLQPLWLVLCLTFFTCYVEALPQPDHTYDVHFSKESPKTVRVQAELAITDNKLEMASWGHALELKDAWAHFIQDLQVTRLDGTAVPLKKQEGPVWQVDIADGQVVKLSYHVNLNHSDYNWRSGGGNDARPQWTGQNLFLISKALFIVSYSEASTANVKLHLPNDWSATTAWQVAGANQYHTKDLWSLIDNALVVGEHQSHEVGIAGMNVRVVTDQDLAPKRQFMTSALKKQLQAFGQIFGEIPNINYLITFRKDSSTDGEAFNNSFNMILDNLDFEKHTIIWAGVLAHEMFHYWTGPLYGQSPQDMEWFKEGFTEYYASLTLARTGIIDEALWFKKLERYLARYYTTRFRLGDRPSLIDAGKEKMKNWFLIYGGGASIALALDIEIRDATDHNKTLDDVMRTMYQKYANTPYTTEDLLAVVNKVSGKEFGGFFKTHIHGDKSMPDYQPILQKAGLILSSFADEFYIRKDPKASEKQQRFYRQLLNQ